MQKTFVVTGSTSGIGLAVAEQLAGMGAFVIGVGRTVERCDAARDFILSAHPFAEVRYMRADLALQSHVRDLAERIRVELASQSLVCLDGLINDAGTFTWHRSQTQEGFERQWAINHLASFLLTHELLPLLASAPWARVVTVSSGAHYHTRLRWNDLQLKHGYNGWLAYKQSKLANVYFTAELRRRLGPASLVQVFAADPGLVHTDLGIKSNPALVRWFWGWWSKRGLTPAEAAPGVVYLATETSITKRPEIYWKHGRPQEPDPLALDPAAGKRLWEISAEMCGL